jgi:hypothetical protein
MNVGVMKNYKLRDLRASHTLDIGEIGHLLSRQNEYFFSFRARSTKQKARQLWCAGGHAYN